MKKYSEEQSMVFQGLVTQKALKGRTRLAQGKRSAALGARGQAFLS
ncbi:MAG: hypothetical protein HQK60_05225 [Deltaproteobacteria bacterium]|nr:hypothetical protein [Deltaproteobacteria bacterium]